GGQLLKVEAARNGSRDGRTRKPHRRGSRQCQNGKLNSAPGRCRDHLQTGYPRRSKPFRPARGTTLQAHASKPCVPFVLRRSTADSGACEGRIVPTQAEGFPGLFSKGMIVAELAHACSLSCLSVGDRSGELLRGFGCLVWTREGYNGWRS